MSTGFSSGVQPGSAPSDGRTGYPLVSVVIPAYNAHAFVARALDSVLAQTYSPFEILLVNDGSPDTALLEQALTPYRDRIRYFCQGNRGPSAARNLAIREAHGSVIAFLDCDDAWFPEHLTRQVALLESDPNLQLVYADSLLIRGRETVGHAFGTEPQHPPVTLEKLLMEQCTVATSTTVASRQALIEAGLFDERFRRCEDFDLWLRICFRGGGISYSPEPSVSHYLTENSLTSDTFLLKRARIEIYEKTASTLPLSAAQRELIRSLVSFTEANCQKDLLKEYLHAGEYEKALTAATLAHELAPHDWRLLATAVSLRRVPGLFRQYHRMHERFLRLRGRRRASQSRRDLKVPANNLGN